MVINGHLLTKADKVPVNFPNYDHVKWNDDTTYNIAPYLQAGENSIFVQYTNEGPGGPGNPEGIVVTESGFAAGKNISTDATWAVRYNPGGLKTGSPPAAPSLADAAAPITGITGFTHTAAKVIPALNLPPASDAIDIKADSTWLVKDPTIDNSVWTGSAGITDSQYLLLRQEINLAPEGLIRKFETISLAGVVAENLSVFIRDSAGTLVPVYQDNTVGNNAWTGTFDPNLLTTGKNWLEVYASKDIVSGNSTINDWIKLDMAQISFTPGT